MAGKCGRWILNGLHESELFVINQFFVLISWQDETRICYEAEGKRPIQKVQDGGSQYTVSRHTISQAMIKGLDISVLIIYGMSSSSHMKQC